MKALACIRWKFVVPVAIVFGALLVFSVFFFDSFLARGIEKAASRLNGARVEVTGLQTKWIKGELRIARLAVADPDRPMTNKIEAGPLRFEIIPSEILKKRVIIPEARIDGIEFGTPRKKSGALPKRVRRKKTSKKPGVVSKLAQKYKDRFHLQLGEVKGEFSSRIKFDEADLHITQQSLALKNKSRGLPEKWKEKVKKLDVGERLKKIERDLRSVKDTPLNGPQALVAIPKSLKTLKDSKNNLNAIKQEVKGLKDDLSEQIRSLKRDVGGLKKAKSEDLAELSRRLNLDFADPRKLAEGLVGKAVLDRATTVLSWIQRARQHLPSKKEKESLPPRPRVEGMFIEFPRPASPPRFWLRLAELSGSYEGIAATGQIKQLNSDPARVGHPAELNLHGKKGRQTFLAQVIVDHTGEDKKDGLTVEITGVDARKLLSSGLLGRALKGGGGSFKLAFNAVGDENIGGQMSFGLGELKLDDAVLLKEAGVDPAQNLSQGDRFKKKFVTEMARAIERMPAITIEANMSGTWKDPKLSLRTNLEPQLKSAITSVVGNVIADQKKNLEAELNKILNKREGELNKQLTRLQGQLGRDLGGFDKDIQSKIQEATGIHLAPSKGQSPLKGLKLPSLDKLFK